MLPQGEDPPLEQLRGTYFRPLGRSLTLIPVATRVPPPRPPAPVCPPTAARSTPPSARGWLWRQPVARAWFWQRGWFEPRIEQASMTTGVVSGSRPAAGRQAALRGTVALAPS